MSQMWRKESLPAFHTGLFANLSGIPWRDMARQSLGRLHLTQFKRLTEWSIS